MLAYCKNFPPLWESETRPKFGVPPAKIGKVLPEIVQTLPNSYLWFRNSAEHRLTYSIIQKNVAGEQLKQNKHMVLVCT